jgi:hypothetical protein
MNLEALTSLEALQAGMDAFARGADVAAAADAVLAGEAENATRNMTEQAAATGAAGGQARDAAGDFATLDAAMGSVGDAVEGMAGKVVASDAAIVAANDAAAGSFVDLGRTAGHLHDTLGLIVTAAEPLLASNARLDSLNHSLADSFGLIRSQAAYAALSEAQLAAVNDALSESFTAGDRIATEMADDAAHAQEHLTAARLASVSATLAMSSAETTLAEVEKFEAMSADEVAAAARKAATATDSASASTARWFGWWRLSGAAIHWIISGTAELLAVALPAAVAASAAAFVLYQGAVEQVGFRLQSLYGATESTDAMIHKTTGDVLGLGHAFQSAQNAADPIAYELLGEYINAARSHMVDLASAGLQVDQALGSLGAKIDVDLIQQSGQLNSLLANMVSDLIGIGQLFGNLGHSILDLAADMPGLAEVLLKIAVGASQVVLWVSKLPGPLITVAVGFEEFSRWGGLVANLLDRMGIAGGALSGSFFSVERFAGILSAAFKALPMLFATVLSNIGSLMTGFGRFDGTIGQAGMALRNFGADMTDGIVAIPVWGAALAALAIGGLALIAYEGTKAKTATMQFTSSLEQAASSATNVNAFGVLANNMYELDNRISSTKSQMASWGETSTGIWNDAAKNGGQATGQLRQNLTTLNAAYQQNEQQMKNVVQGAEYLSKAYGGTLAQSEALADAAGVKLIKGITGTGTAAMQAQAQVAGLVAGYKGMDQTGGILGNDMNALSIQVGLQDTKVQQLNQAWSGIMSNATGLTSNFADLTTDIGEINNAITQSGKKFTTFSGQAVSSTTAAAMSMKSFSGVGAQVWQNYDAALQQAEQYTQSLNTAAAYGAVGQKAYTQQIAYTVQQLLPYAKYSQTAAAQLGILVQQAGGPATSSFKQLKQWVDANSESAKQFNKQTASETVQLSDVSKAASEFASTLDSDVASALDNAKVSSANLTQAAENLNNAWQKAHDTISGPVVSAFSGLVSSLTRVYGSTKTAEGIADAYARSMGFTQSQVNALNRDVGGLIARLSQIPSNKTVNLTVTGNITPGGQAALAAAGVSPVTIAHIHGFQAGAAYVPPGLAMVGEHGPEFVKFQGGESVSPSWQTAPVSRAGGGSGGGSLLIHNHLYVDGRELLDSVQDQTFQYNRRNGLDTTGSLAP